MRHRRIWFVAALLITASAVSGQVSGQSETLEKARVAFSLRDYAAAIRLCDAGLSVSPEDYELGFLRARALAYSGDHDRAAVETGRLLTLFPGNADILLLKARVDTWRGRTFDAEAAYNIVLRSNPRDIDALCGLAALALRRGDMNRAAALVSRAVEAAPAAASVLYWKGRAEEASGLLEAARKSFLAAQAVNPLDSDIAAALNRVAVRHSAGTEIRYRFGLDDYGSQQTAFFRHELAVQFETPRGLGPAVFKLARTERFGHTDVRFGVELYPRLWRGAYGSIDLGFSPAAVSFARNSFRFEVFQRVLGAGEISAGYWGMNFPGRRVSIVLGSAAAYFGPYYGVFRAYYDTLAPDRRVSWVCQLRGYFSGSSFISVGYGRGERLSGERTAEDLLIERSQAITAGATVYVFRHVRLELSLARVRDASGLRLDSIEAATGYRW